MAAESPPNALRMGERMPPRDTWPPINDQCAVARTLGVIATRSAFMVLREAFYGATRFDQFAERAQISEPVAAARLRELAEEGLLENVPYREPGQRTRYEYHLTRKGADLFPTLMALWDWGDRWMFEDGSRLQLSHRDCGASVHAAVTCEQGHTVPPEEIEITRRR
jgi:DNA-binding HxlR family transcriptional regulator